MHIKLNLNKVQAI